MADPFAHCGGALGAGRVANRYQGMTDDEYAKHINRVHAWAARNLYPNVEEYVAAEKAYATPPNAVDQVNDGVDQEYAVITKFDELVAKLQNVARTLDEIALAAMEVRP